MTVFLNNEQILVRMALLIVLVAMQMHNVAGTSATPPLISTPPTLLHHVQ
jgi:hypothetical protein